MTGGLAGLSRDEQKALSISFGCCSLLCTFPVETGARVCENECHGASVM